MHLKLLEHLKLNMKGGEECLLSDIRRKYLVEFTHPDFDSKKKLKWKSVLVSAGYREFFEVFAVNKVFWVKRLAEEAEVSSTQVNIAIDTPLQSTPVSSLGGGLKSNGRAEKRKKKTVVEPKKAGANFVLQLDERPVTDVTLNDLVKTTDGELVSADNFEDFIFANRASSCLESKRALITEVSSLSLDQAAGNGLLGTSIDSDSIIGGRKAVYLNTNEPFFAVCIGVQGAGKSHTMNAILENCLLDTLNVKGKTFISSVQAMCGLVLHFDQSSHNMCESVGLYAPADLLKAAFPECKVRKTVVFVSSNYIVQKQKFYGPGFEVLPLLFDWDSLTASQLKKLMHLTETDSQLYVSVILSMLSDYQRTERIPSFQSFCDEISRQCTSSAQSGPLKQRLEILKTFIRQSAKNVQSAGTGCNIATHLEAGTLLVVDLSDPLMTTDDACGVFQVLLEQFRNHPMGNVGKVVTFDEAHKYLNKSSPGCVELTNAIVDTVRLMRHEGIRVLISTQSPLTMPPELLELTSVTILHKFQSADWAKYLGLKVTLPEGGFHEIQSLQQGQALLLSTHISAPERSGDTATVSHLKINIRPRLTRDLGASRRNEI